jgi:hypothetical protein
MWALMTSNLAAQSPIVGLDKGQTRLIAEEAMFMPQEL